MAGRIVVIASGKGGSGKSTLATLLTITLGATRHPLAVIDADPHATLDDWLSVVYEGPPVDCKALATAEGVVDHAKAAADKGCDVLIDTAGFGSHAARAALVVADAVLVPMMADRGSVREALTMRDHAQDLNEHQAPIKAVFSQWSARGLAESAAIEDIANAGMEALKTVIPALAALRQLSFTGRLPAGRPFDVGVQLVTELQSLRILSRPRSKKGPRS